MFGQFRRKWKRSQSTCAFNFKGVFFVFLKLLVCCPGESIVFSVILNEMHSLIRYLELGKVDRLSSQNGFGAQTTRKSGQIRSEACFSKTTR